MNRLLAALPPEEMEVLRPGLEKVSLAFKKSLYEINQPIEFVYFIHRGVVSMVAEMEDGTEIEVAIVGPEGIVGLPVFLDAEVMASRAFPQVPGEGSRIEAWRFRRALEQTPRLRQLLSRYTLALVNQLCQNSACNRTHAVEQRLARWLLMTHDRVHGATFPLTQEFMAQMLGVSRPTVSIAAGVLMKAGVITYSRGNLTVSDRRGLEAVSCECYGAISKFDRLIAGSG